MPNIPSWISTTTLQAKALDVMQNGLVTPLATQIAAIEKIGLVDGNGMVKLKETIALMLGALIADSVNGTTGFTAISPAGGWSNVGGAYYDAGYLKDSFGKVHLRGRIISGLGPGVAFTLPSGYRPNKTATFIAAHGTDWNAHVVISNDGQVNISYSGGDDWVSLDGISFYADYVAT